MAKSKLFRDTQLAAIVEGVSLELPTHKTFCDPFCNDAHMVLTKNGSDKEILSVDNIVCADGLRALQTLSDSDIAKLAKRDWVSTKKTFQHLRRSESGTDVAKAHRFLYCSHFSVSQLCKSWDESTEGVAKKVTVEDLKEARDRLAKAEINCEDFVRAIARSDSKETLFFMEPGASVDASALMDSLRKMEGKFVLVCDDGFADLNGFNVNRVRKFQTEVSSAGVVRKRGMTQIVATNFGVVSKSAFSESGFEVDEPELSVEMVNVAKHQGGGHYHILDRAKKETDIDGAHSHVFMREDKNGNPIFLWTLYDGPHQHKLSKADAEETKVDGKHFHKIRVYDGYDGFFDRSRMLQTEKDGEHSHELDVEDTVYDGSHVHTLDFDGETLTSVTPGQFAALMMKKDESPYDMIPVDGARVREGAIKSRILESGELYVDVWLDNGSGSLGWNLADICETSKFADADEARQVAKRFSVNGDRAFNSLTEKSIVKEIGESDTGIIPLDCDEIQTLAKFEYERGLQTENSREFFVYGEGELRGVLDVIRDSDGVFKARLRKNLSPAILSERAQLEKWLMPGNLSGLPKSLEKIVPENLRYWEHSGEEALAKRASLAASGLLDGDSLAFVGDRIRKVVKSFDLYQPKDETEELDENWIVKRIGQHFDGEISEAFGDDESASSGEVMLHDFSGHEDVPAAVEAAFKSEGDVVVMCEDTEDHRDLLSKYARPFNFKPDTPEHAAEVSSLLFAASFPLTKTGALNWAGLSRERAEVKTDWPAIEKKGKKEKEKGSKKPYEKGHDVQLCKAGDGEEQFILGIVLQPETTDSQGDIYSAEEVRKSAHEYMVKYQAIGLMHKGEVDEKEVSIVESYLSPTTFTVGDQEIKKGAWLLGAKVHNTKLWDSVKKGDLTGWSIGGLAVRTPES